MYPSSPSALLLTLTLSTLLPAPISSHPLRPPITNKNNHNTTIPNLTLLPAFPSPPGPPAWFRTAPPLPTLALLAFATARSLGPFTQDAPLGHDYWTCGPESEPRLSHLDTRIIFRQYVSRDWGFVGREEEEDVAVKARRLRKGEVVQAARMLANGFAAGGNWREGVWKMCYLEEGGGRVVECSGVVMVQRDLWLRGG